MGKYYDIAYKNAPQVTPPVTLKSPSSVGEVSAAQVTQPSVTVRLAAINDGAEWYGERKH